MHPEKDEANQRAILSCVVSIMPHGDSNTMLVQAWIDLVYFDLHRVAFSTLVLLSLLAAGLQPTLLYLAIKMKV